MGANSVHLAGPADALICRNECVAGRVYVCIDRHIHLQCIARMVTPSLSRQGKIATSLNSDLGRSRNRHPYFKAVTLTVFIEPTRSTLIPVTQSKRAVIGISLR
jgi:hypothetical protein